MKITMSCGAQVNARHPNPIKHKLKCDTCQKLDSEKLWSIADINTVRITEPELRDIPEAGNERGHI